MFSERVKKVRKEAGLTQKELAQLLQLSIGTIAMWETGKREPKLETMVHLSNTLNTSVDYLLGLSEDEMPQTIERIESNDESGLQVQAEVIYSCSDYDLVLIKKHSK